MIRHAFSKLCVLSLALGALPLAAAEVEVVIENVAPEAGVILTPMWLGFHDGSFDTYSSGESADNFPGLENIAEDGNTGPLMSEFSLQQPDGAQVTATGPSSAPPIFPGETTTRRFDLDPQDHRYFSYASMVIPSNDAFVSNGNPLAHRVFDPAGNFTGFEFYIMGKSVLDAGTEVNDEVPSNVAALEQAAPQTGVDENGVIGNHPGFNAGGAILTAIPNGDFELPGYLVAKITVRAVPTTEVRFSGSGAQEVPPALTAATAACRASLNNDGDELSVSCDHNITNTVVAAHVHTGVEGENGPVLLPFADVSGSTISQTFDVTAEQAAAFVDGGLYVNIHSDVFPNGEVRAQVDGCFAGPESLCLNNDRFQVSALYSANGNTGSGMAVEAAADSGFFTFFSETNIELDVKVLDGCATDNPHYWVFAAGLTNVGVTLTVEDTLADETRQFINPEGQTFVTITDTSAFQTCP